MKEFNLTIRTITSVRQSLFQEEVNQNEFIHGFKENI